MNTRFLPWLLVLCALCPKGAGEETSSLDLGNIMFVGDSITHGFKAPSYRWPLHKTLVDNGVLFVPVGVHVGNAFREGSVEPGTPYAGVSFSNRHSAMSSERAYEIAGRINTSGRLGNSNIHDWLGLDTSYSGDFRLDMSTQTPDTVVMMIGTNDTFGDYGSRGGVGAGNNMQQAQSNLIGTESEDGTWSGTGDMDVIVDALRQVNPKVRVLLLTVPTWHDARRNNNKAVDFAALAGYNEALARWAAGKGIPVADVNRVLVNPARVDKPGVAEIQYFHPADRLHPTPQGDLLIAETVAKALGCPGRTAGLPRRDSSDFECVGVEYAEQGGSGLSVDSAIVRPVNGCGGFTVALRASVGNGGADGWVQDSGLRLTFGSGEQKTRASLTISESSVIWQEDRVLYSGDMSLNDAEIRIVWHSGAPQKNIPQGYYVWLGDRLIGEALPADAADSREEGIRAIGQGNGVSLRGVQLRATSGCYAPPAP